MGGICTRDLERWSPPSFCVDEDRLDNRCPLLLFDLGKAVPLQTLHLSELESEVKVYFFLLSSRSLGQSFISIMSYLAVNFKSKK